jgi:predicted lipoprotein with Yx(FWY)xxD motif
MNATTKVIPLLGLGALALLAAACGNDEPGASAAVSPSSEPATTVDTAFEVDLVEGTPLGTLLVDPEGMTVYSTEREAAGEIECVDDCSADWLPVAVSEEPVVPDELADRIGTVERPDGTLQATFDDMPLYTFAFDEQPGDTFGDNLEDMFGGTGFVWHAAVLTEPSPSSTDVEAGGTPGPTSTGPVDDDYDFPY